MVSPPSSLLPPPPLRSIAGVYSAVGWSNYYIDPANQRSNEMWLEKGKEYLLVSEMAEHYGADYINVCIHRST